MRVGIVSCYFMHNYGSVLQAYATQQVLDQLGVENETINVAGFLPKLKKRQARFYLRNLGNQGLQQKLRGFAGKKISKFRYRSFRQNLQQRDAAFETFLSKRMRLSQECSLSDLPHQVGRSYSDVLLGSDQLWLPQNIAADYYTLSFVPDSIGTVAYATSFGVTSLPRHLEPTARDFLNRFDYLSVREYSGATLIHCLTNREAEVVCDPTMLLTADQWSAQLPDQQETKKPYIFCYFMGENQDHRRFAKELGALTGFQLIVFRHLDAYLEADEAFGDEAPYGAGPHEFVEFIRNAQYVCTDSFHATLFSILYHKEFFTFMRFQHHKGMSTNTRIDTLLQSVQLENRLVSNLEPPDRQMNHRIDYTAVDQCVRDIRLSSLAYLTSALKLTGTVDSLSPW